MGITQLGRRLTQRLTTASIRRTRFRVPGYGRRTPLHGAQPRSHPGRLEQGQPCCAGTCSTASRAVEHRSTGPRRRRRRAESARRARVALATSLARSAMTATTSTGSRGEITVQPRLEIGQSVGGLRREWMRSIRARVSGVIEGWLGVGTIPPGGRRRRRTSCGGVKERPPDEGTQPRGLPHVGALLAFLTVLPWLSISNSCSHHR
jgi:hypothetical protein